MTAGEPGGTAPNVSALVDALDQRARQAGSEGATTVLRGMLASVSEMLSGIESRLDRIEDRVGDESPDAGISEQIQAGLAAFNARLGRLEEAFVQAVEDSGSGTQTIVDQIREAVEASLSDHRPEEGAPIAAAEVDLGPVLAAVERLGRRVDELDLESPAPDLTPIERRLEELAVAVAAPPPPSPPTPPQPPAPPVDLGPIEERLDAMAAELSRLSADERGAQVVSLVESRLGAALDAIAGRTDAAIEALSAARVPVPTPPLPDLGSIERRLAELSRQAEAQKEDVQKQLERVVEVARTQAEEIRAATEAQVASIKRAITHGEATPGITADQVHEVVRREAELLTQRVASLAVSLDSLRSVLDEHVEETANSIGRKATEVTRKLAADFGWRGRRSSDKNRDPRSLPRGGH